MRKNLFMPYANSEGADQPAHPRSLISTFVVHCLDSIIPLVSIPQISSLYPASVTVQASLSLPWSKTPKTGFLVTRLNYNTSKRHKWNGKQCGPSLHCLPRPVCLNTKGYYSKNYQTACSCCLLHFPSILIRLYDGVKQTLKKYT